MFLFCDVRSAYPVFLFVLQPLLFCKQQQCPASLRSNSSGNPMVLPTGEFLREKTARDLLVFGFSYITVHILTIRQIDHPFIPLPFHWNALLKSPNSHTCTTLWF